MMKFEILENHSGDAGFYHGITEKVFGNVVEAEYCDGRKNSIYVKGSEFIRIGGDATCFNPEWGYMWGDFEEVQDGN